MGAGFLTKSGGGRKHRDRLSRKEEPAGEGGPDEAAAFIAEAVAELAKLARRHELGLLEHLLSMAQLEAEEHVRLRSKRKLS